MNKYSIYETHMSKNDPYERFVISSTSYGNIQTLLNTIIVINEDPINDYEVRTTDVPQERKARQTT